MFSFHIPQTRNEYETQARPNNTQELQGRKMLFKEKIEALTHILIASNFTFVSPMEANSNLGSVKLE